MKTLLVLTVLLASLTANASAFNYGDFVTGSASVPASGAVIADSGAMTFYGPTEDFYNLVFNASCSLQCVVTVGIYSSTGTALKTYVMQVAGGSTSSITIPRVGLTTSSRFEIVNSAANLGTVSGSIALNQIANY